MNTKTKEFVDSAEVMHFKSLLTLIDKHKSIPDHSIPASDVSYADVIAVTETSSTLFTRI